MNQNKTQGFGCLKLHSICQSMIIHLASVSQGDGINVTVVNPISSTSPIPDGSCVVTGKFNTPLNILESNDDDINVTALIFN